MTYLFPTIDACAASLSRRTRACQISSTILPITVSRVSDIPLIAVAQLMYVNRWLYHPWPAMYAYHFRLLIISGAR
jgi:hypothetical protein